MTRKIGLETHPSSVTVTVLPPGTGWIRVVRSLRRERPHDYGLDHSGWLYRGDLQTHLHAVPHGLVPDLLSLGIISSAHLFDRRPPTGDCADVTDHGEHRVGRLMQRHPARHGMLAGSMKPTSTSRRIRPTRTPPTIRIHLVTRRAPCKTGILNQTQRRRGRRELQLLNTKTRRHEECLLDPPFRHSAYPARSAFSTILSSRSMPVIATVIAPNSSSTLPRKMKGPWSNRTCPRSRKTRGTARFRSGHSRHQT